MIIRWHHTSWNFGSKNECYATGRNFFFLFFDAIVHYQICLMDFDCSQVLVRNVPPDPDESVSESVEHFFLVNHPDHYLTHQVCSCSCCLIMRPHTMFLWFSCQKIHNSFVNLKNHATIYFLVCTLFISVISHYKCLFWNQLLRGCL